MQVGDRSFTSAPQFLTGVLMAALGTAFLVVGSSQAQTSVEHNRIPARLEALFNNSKLHFELKSNHYDHALVAMMLTEDIDMIEETTGMTAMGLAAKDESADAFDMVEPLVLKYGADLNLADAEGYTALHYASAAGNLAVVKFLANFGARVEVEKGEEKDKRRKGHRITPLYMAYKYDRPRVAEFLRMRGAIEIDPDVRAHLELTHSMSAIAGQIEEMLDQLSRTAEQVDRLHRNKSQQPARAPATLRPEAQSPQEP
ncbi:MAG: ankyrin repeat domain-containing protein [Bryobacterales bacterium]|nr:ankyrin repeat domain-containing protein [Bryobacterales bacterium]